MHSELESEATTLGPDTVRPRTVTAEAWQMLSSLLEATRLMPPKLRAPDASLPLTLITGFLGAGKTTLLNRLLADPGGRRLAVLVNDFGSINIDASLIRSRTEDMISLTNGCACCTVSTDLTRTLIDLAQREDPPDAIVLEASGLADPRGIAQVALSNPSLRLDGVLTLVDTTLYAGLHADATNSGHPVSADTLVQPPEEVLRTVDGQIDAADLIVLTKIDEASTVQALATRKALAQRFPGKPQMNAVLGELPSSLVLGLRSKRDFRQEPLAPWDHSEGFESCALQSSTPLDSALLHKFLESLPSSLLRAKGVLWLVQDPQHRQIFQRVGRRWSIAPEDSWGLEHPASSLVLIAPKGSLDRPELQRRFSALASASACSSPAPQSAAVTQPS